MKRAVVGIIAVLAIALALAGCVETPATGTTLDPRISGQWVLSTGSDAVGTIGANDAYATLTIGHGTLSSGRGPCRDYTARILGTLSGLSVRADPANSNTCATSSLDSFDKRYFDALRHTDFATVSSGRLALRGPSTTLTFKRPPALATKDFVDIEWAATSERIGGNASGAGTLVTSGTVIFSLDGTFSVEEQGCPPTAGAWSLQAGEVIVTLPSTGMIGCTSRLAIVRLNGLLRGLGGGFLYTRTANIFTTTNPRTLDTVLFVLPTKSLSKREYDGTYSLNGH